MQRHLWWKNYASHFPVGQDFDVSFSTEAEEGQGSFWVQGYLSE